MHNNSNACSPTSASWPRGKPSSTSSGGAPGQHDFGIKLAGFYEPTPTEGGRSNHALTRVRQDLATILALTVKRNVAYIVHDADEATDGVAIFGKLVKACGQSDGDGAAYLLQLKESPFYTAGDVTVCVSNFAGICNDYKNTTGTSTPNWI